MASDTLTNLEKSIQVSQPARAWVSLLAFVAVLGLGTDMFIQAYNIHGPLTSDHPVHLSKIWLIKEQLITEGRWFGWTHYLRFGYPLNYTYPQLAYAFVLLIHLLSGTLLTLQASYFLAALSASLLNIALVFLLARHFGGLAAGIFAALLTIYDYGSFQVGGTIWYNTTGVWASQLSVGLFLVFIHLLLRTARLDSWRLAGAAGLSLGVSILAHPIAGPASIVALLAVSCSALSLKGDLGGGLRGFVLKLSVIFAIGYAISAIWVLPYLSIQEFTSPISKQWISLPAALKRLTSGGFLSMPAHQTCLGGIGLLICFAQRRVSFRFFGVFAVLLIIAGSTSFLSLITTVLPLKKFELIRLTIFLRPLFAVGAGVSFAILCRQLSVRKRMEQFDGDDGSPCSPDQKTNYRIWRDPLVLLLLVLVPYLLYQKQMTVRRKVGRVAGKLKTHFSEEHRANLLQTLKEIVDRQPEGFFRIHIKDTTPGHIGTHTLKGFIRELGVPMSFNSFFPATNFRHVYRHRDRRLLARYGVRFYITPERFKSPKWLSFETSSGPWNIYRVKASSRFPVEISEGKGKTALRTFSNSEIVFDVTRKSEGEVRVNISPFSRWVAYINEVPTPIEIRKSKGLYGSHALFLPLQAGRYRLVFETGWPEYLGAVIALSGVMLAFLLMLFGRSGKSMLFSQLFLAIKKS